MKAHRLALLATAIVPVLIGLDSTTALAATRSWDGGDGADTDWTTDATWDVFKTVPALIDTARFDRGAAFSFARDVRRRLRPLDPRRRNRPPSELLDRRPR